MSVQIYEVQKNKFIKVTLGDFEVTLADLGASIFSIKLNGDYMTSNPSEEDFLKNNNYYGKTVGRVANRIGGDVITLEGKSYKLEKNEGPNVLHGGVNGLSTKTFKYEITESNQEITVIFSYLSKDLEAGFPGNLDLKVIYKVTPNKVYIGFDAISDKDTLLTLTNHNFYCVGAKSNDELNLMIKAGKFIHPNPADLLPIEIRDVNPLMDFRNGKDFAKYLNDPYLKNSRSNGYDHFFIFEEINPNIDQIILCSKKYEFSVDCDYEGTQIYTDNYETPFKIMNSPELKTNRGIAIEPSSKIIDVQYLKKGERYQHYMNLKFRKVA